MRLNFLVKSENIISEIPIIKIRPNKAQPRKQFNEDELSALSRSIAENGILQPLTVRKVSNTEYELIAGKDPTATDEFLLVMPDVGNALDVNIEKLPFVALKSFVIFIAWILSFKAIKKMPISLYGILDLSRVLFGKNVVCKAI